MAVYQRKTTQSKYQVERFSGLLKRKPQYGANEAGIERRSPDEPRYIRITDIDEYGMLKRELGKTAQTVESRYLLKNNDLLFARSGTVGKTYIHKANEIIAPCFYAGYMIRFVVNEEKINPDYVFAYTQLETYKNWVTAIQRVALQPNINAEEYKSLKIPVPPKEIQTQIVVKMVAAYAARKQREAEAQRLQDSIDDYLLSELGIEPPEPEESGLRSRIFFRNASEISGARLDPSAYKKERLDAIANIERGAYVSKPLYRVVRSRREKTSDFPKGAIYIGLENVESDTGEWLSSESKESISNAAIFKKGDVLFPKLRPYLNKVFYCATEGFCSTEFHVFRSSSENNSYIAHFLRSKVVVAQTRNLMSGNTLPRLQFGDIQKLLIPVPPLEKQAEIAERIAETRSQAKELREEAKKKLEEASKEAEAMIFGG